MKELHEKEDNSLVNTMVSKIIQNFELLVEDVHIRYEDHSSDPKHPFSAGVTLHSLAVSPNQEGESSAEEKHNGLFSKTSSSTRWEFTGTPTANYRFGRMTWTR